MSKREELKQKFDKTLYNYDILGKERNRQLREIEKELVQLLDIQIGQIFYESWGYDQTNVDFLQVIEVSPTKKTVICQMIGQKRTDSYSVAPNPNYKYGSKFRLHIKCFGDEPRLRGSYPFCSNHNYANDPTGYKGAWREGSFRPYEGKPVYETPEGMGH